MYRAFQLGKRDYRGKSATTHHDFLESLRENFSRCHLKSGLRFVEGDKIQRQWSNSGITCA